MQIANRFTAVNKILCNSAVVIDAGSIVVISDFIIFYKVPLFSCSLSMASNSALKLPTPKDCAPFL